VVLCGLVLVVGHQAQYIGQSRWPWSIVYYGSFVAIALISILGLYLTAKILIEIFK
jgi:hypothetical protein